MTSSTLIRPLCGLVMQRKGDSRHGVAGDLIPPKYAVDEISATLDKSEVKRLEDCDGLELGMGRLMYSVWKRIFDKKASAASLSAMQPFFAPRRFLYAAKV